MSIDGGAGKGNVSEDHVGGAKNEIFELHMGIDRYRIPQPARVADNRVPLDIGVLAETAIFADHGPRRDVRKIPYFRVFPDLRALLYNRGWMDKGRRSIFLECRQNRFLSWHGAQWAGTFCSSG